MAKKIDLSDRIKSVRLTKVEEKIALFFLENEGSLCFINSKEIAISLNVSDTSVIRTCRALGYKGFAELQESIRQKFSSIIEKDRYVIPLFQVADKFQKYRESDNAVYLNMMLKNLRNVSLNNGIENYRHAAEIISNSKRIFVLGFRGLAGAAMSFSVGLRQFLPNVECATDADTYCIERMLDYDEGDCVILLGVERYSSMSCAIADMAREHHCKLVAITDKITAPIAYQADTVFLSEFSSPMVIHSFLCTQFIVESILFEISKLQNLNLENRLSNLNKYLEKVGLY